MGQGIRWKFIEYLVATRLSLVFLFLSLFFDLSALLIFFSYFSRLLLFYHFFLPLCFPIELSLFYRRKFYGGCSDGIVEEGGGGGGIWTTLEK